MDETIKAIAESVKTIADAVARSEQEMRLSLALFGAAIAMHPSINASKLLSDFDRQLEASTSHDKTLPMAAMDIRAALAAVIQGLKEAGQEGSDD